MRALFDVNVLVAMIDAQHRHHERARRWWNENRHEGWASCSITQNGFVRILSQPSYPHPTSLAGALGLLRSITAGTDHEFWGGLTQIVDQRRFDSALIAGPGQIGDIYLLGLAVEHEGRLVTLDRRIPVAAVHGAGPHHIVLL